MLFARCQTQWQRNAMNGMPTGLDYVGLEAAARLSGVVITPELFEQIGVLELAYLKATHGRVNPAERQAERGRQRPRR